MAIAIELRDEHGGIIDSASTRRPAWRIAHEGAQPVSHWRPPAFGDRRFPLLSRIDPYGDTMFNRLQVEPLLDELRVVRDDADDDVARAWVDEIIRLAHGCRAQTHTYLWFIGD